MCFFYVGLGNVLQIVSAPGQQLIRPQGSMVMQTVPQTVPASNPSAASAPQPGLPTTQQGDLVKPNMLLPNYSWQLFSVSHYRRIFSMLRTAIWNSHQVWCFLKLMIFSFFLKPWASLQMQHQLPQSSLPQPMPVSRSVHWNDYVRNRYHFLNRWVKANNCWNISPCDVQESSEEKSQQLKNRLARLCEANERRCSRSVLYGADLLQFCALNFEAPQDTLTGGSWRWVGRESCLRAQQTCMASTSSLQSILHTTEDCHVGANNLIKRYLWIYIIYLQYPY